MLTRSSLWITLLALGCSPALDGVVDDTPTGSGGDASSAGGGPGSGGSSAGGSATGAGNPGGAGPGGAGPGGAGPGGAGGATGFCGDGVLDPASEQCDEDDLGGADCVEAGFPLGGNLQCNPNCTFDASGCETGSCGNGVQEAGEACDDSNNEPNDGCSPSCQLQGATCTSAIDVIVTAGNFDIGGNTEALAASTAPPDCAGGGTGAGRELFFRLVPDQAGILTLTLFPDDTEFDSVLYARQGCGAPSQQISCHDNYETTNGNSGGEVLSFPVSENTPIIVIVDGFEMMDAGEFTLNIDLSSGDNCSDVVPIYLDGAIVPPITGTTQAGWVHDTSPGIPCVVLNSGIDMVYEITTPASEPNSNVSVEAGFDAVIYARSTCNGNQIACDSGIIGNPEIDVNLSSTPRYIWVDTESNTGGLFRLHADIDP